jgi:hypothetical protein
MPLENIDREQAKDEIYALHAAAEHFGLVISTAPRDTLNFEIVD